VILPAEPCKLSKPQWQSSACAQTTGIPQIDARAGEVGKRDVEPIHH
jgi:hypothetical protein